MLFAHSPRNLASTSGPLAPPRRAWLAGLGALIGTLALAALPAGASDPSQAEIHIGASAALSGPAAALGLRYHAGARAYFKQLNQHGGIHGSRLVLDLLDDAYEPERTEANTRQLIEQARTLALFGYVGTPTSLAALPFVKRSKLAFVGAYSGADALREPINAQVFNVRASYAQEGVALAQAMRRDGVRRVDVIYQADLFGRSGLEAIRDAAQKAKLQLDQVVTVKRNSADVARPVRELLERSSASAGSSQAIFMVSSYASCAAIVREARKQGFRGRFYTLSFAGLEPLREALGAGMKGLTLAQVMPDAENRKLPLVAEYQQAMLAAGEHEFDSISLEGYVSARVLAEGLRRAKPPLTRESVAPALESLGALDLGGLRLHFSAQRHQGSDLVELRVGK